MTVESKKKIIMYKWEGFEMFIINIIDDIIVIIIITINHIMFQDLYKFGLYELIMSPKSYKNVLWFARILLYVLYEDYYGKYMLNKCYIHWTFEKLMLIGKTTSSKHAKHIWRNSSRMSFIPHMIFWVTQMVMLLLCLLLCLSPIIVSNFLRKGT